MSKYKVILLDVDGVLIQVDKFFSHVYAEKYGYDKQDFEIFFSKHFVSAARGEVDLKDLITKHNDIWRWNGDPQEVLTMWFDYENQPNKELVEVVKQAKKRGSKVYLATNQEKNRAKYIKDIFASLIDGAFMSSELGCLKTEPKFFKEVIARLSKLMPELKPSEIIYLDDDPADIKAARAQGIDAHVYKSVAQAKKYLTS
jgi:putative hydrolase of the HAD superfamily